MDLGLAETLIGLDPLDPVAIWDRLYVGTAMTGRRGALVHALGALDIALWDICGKAAGKPTWELLGSAARETFRPYASLLPSVANWDGTCTARWWSRWSGPRASAFRRPSSSC